MDKSSQIALNQELFALPELTGIAMVADVLARVFSHRPDNDLLRQVHEVASALGVDASVPDQADEALIRRFYNRMVVAPGPLYVPLTESCIRQGYWDGDRFVYGHYVSRFADHVIECYQAVQFPWEQVGGKPEGRLLTLHGDSLVCELAFLSALAHRAITAIQRDDDAAAADTSVRLMVQFAQEPPAQWIDEAHACLTSTQDDFYARACELASIVAHSIAADQVAD